jgi:hypothetical protein
MKGVNNWRIHMALNDFRAIYLPYCIEKLKDGSWVVLNREYKPVGFRTENYIKYEDFPVAAKFKGLTPAKLRKLSYTGSVTGDRVYLYQDSTNPLLSQKNMEEYQKRLEILAKLKVS